MFKNRPDGSIVLTGKGSTALNNVLVQAAKVILGVFALFAASQVQIPLKPVPITFQTIIVSIIGLTYSPRLGFTTLLTYLSLGAIGLPMFTKFGSGIDHLTGITAGYLLGFLVATPTISYLKKFLNENFLSIFYCLSLAHIIIYTLGVAWLATFIGLEKALYSGFFVYIPTGTLKILVFSTLFSYLNNNKK